MNIIYLLILMTFNINTDVKAVTDYDSVALASFATFEQCQKVQDDVDLDKFRDSADVVGVVCTPYILPE